MTMTNADYEHVAFQEDLDKIRRIEAEPVRHAHWIINIPRGINGEPDFVCSSCIMHSWFSTRYCPNCGALMDGEIEGKSKK